MATKRERADVAAACGDSVSYLYQIAGQHRYASPLMATQIEHYTVLWRTFRMVDWSLCLGRAWFDIQRFSTVSCLNRVHKKQVATMMPERSPSVHEITRVDVTHIQHYSRNPRRSRTRNMIE